MNENSELTDRIEGPPDEMAFAWSLALNPEYRTVNGGRNVELIAAEVNRAYHGDQPVRKKNSLATALSNYKSGLSSDEASKEDQFRKSPSSGRRSRTVQPESNVNESKSYLPESVIPEAELGWNMGLDPKNRNEDGRINWNEVLYEVNKTYPAGQELRNGLLMGAIVNLYRKSLPKSELLKENELEYQLLYSFGQKGENSEVHLAWSLALDPFYRTARGERNLEMIADELNYVHHSNSHTAVRSGWSVTPILNGYMSSLPEDEGLKEYELRFELLSDFMENSKGPRMAFAWSLALNPSYRDLKDGARNMTRISDMTNKFHNPDSSLNDPDRPVTSIHEFTSMLDEYKSSLPANEALKEDQLQETLRTKPNYKTDFYLLRNTLQMGGLWPNER